MRRRWVTYDFDALYAFGFFGRVAGPGAAADRRWFWHARQARP